jgi:serine/threonine-protein kinase RsbW
MPVVGASYCCGPICKPALLANLPAFQESLGICAAENGVPPDRAQTLALAFEEVFVNICSYAYPQEPGDVTLACQTEAGAFVTEIMDHGQPFDPTHAPDPGIRADLESRPPGGLGCFLISRLADDFQYRRVDGRNIVRLVLRLVQEVAG